jgi:antitoxin VapB
MPLSVTDPEVERLTEELARRHGISKTEVIRQALRHEAARETPVQQHSDYVERVLAFARALRAEGDPENGLPITKEWRDSLYE